MTDTWFTATGTVQGAPTRIGMGPNGPSSDDAHAIELLQVIAEGAPEVAIEGVWSGTGGFHHLLQAAATVRYLMPDAEFAPPLRAGPLPPDVVA